MLKSCACPSAAAPGAALLAEGEGGALSLLRHAAAATWVTAEVGAGDSAAVGFVERTDKGAAVRLHVRLPERRAGDRVAGMTAGRGTRGIEGWSTHPRRRRAARCCMQL